MTSVQAKDKYNALKKRWKDVIDAEGRTGENRRIFKYRDQFEAVYGFKASTRPKAVCDNRNVVKQMVDDGTEGGGQGQDVAEDGGEGGLEEGGEESNWKRQGEGQG